ncbi:MAG: helix-turn-helix transcriptional regulator [Betaproteobacteria bacterium]
MSTREVGEYLRLKERKIYDLVAQGVIPHSRISGKLLFPRSLVDEWVRRGMHGTPLVVARSVPAVLAGSHDPLLEWAVRESRCGLATMTYGSLDGIDRLLAGAACAAAIHLPAELQADGRTLDRNVALAGDRLAHMDCVLLEWATREQGLVLAAKNPLKIRALSDLMRKKTRVMIRQPGAGSHLLLLQLLADAGVDSNALSYVSPPAQTESEVAAAILDGRADVGLAVRAVAQQFHLMFVPLTVERLDIAVLRGSYFDAPLQTLLTFTHSPLFKRQAKMLAGYDVAGLGRVRWNA